MALRDTDPCTAAAQPWPELLRLIRWTERGAWWLRATVPVVCLGAIAAIAGAAAAGAAGSAEWAAPSLMLFACVTLCSPMAVAGHTVRAIAGRGAVRRQLALVGVDLGDLAKAADRINRVERERDATREDGVDVGAARTDLVQHITPGLLRVPRVLVEHLGLLAARTRSLAVAAAVTGVLLSVSTVAGLAAAGADLMMAVPLLPMVAIAVAGTVAVAVGLQRAVAQTRREMADLLDELLDEEGVALLQEQADLFAEVELLAHAVQWRHPLTT